jgi:hypothetical protein
MNKENIKNTIWKRKFSILIIAIFAINNWALFVQKQDYKYTLLYQYQAIPDEGGLTSHAAIVARELNIPCIVGTKMGTKVFKNGDMVEVDAQNGIVKILKRAK